MSCNILEFKNCEIKGSTFNGRKIVLKKRDEKADNIYIQVKTQQGIDILKIDSIKNNNNYFIPFKELESFKSFTYNIEYWAELEGIGLELLAIEQLQITDKPNCNGCHISELNLNVNLGDTKLEFSISESIINVYLGGGGSSVVAFYYDEESKEFVLEQSGDAKDFKVPFENTYVDSFFYEESNRSLMLNLTNGDSYEVPMISNEVTGLLYDIATERLTLTQTSGNDLEVYLPKPNDGKDGKDGMKAFVSPNDETAIAQSLVDKVNFYCVYK